MPTLDQIQWTSDLLGLDLSGDPDGTAGGAPGNPSGTPSSGAPGGPPGGAPGSPAMAARAGRGINPTEDPDQDAPIDTTPPAPDVITGADAAPATPDPTTPDAATPAPDVISGADPAATPQPASQKAPLSKPPPVKVDPPDPSHPHLGADLQLNVPWSIQGSLVLKDFNLASLGDSKKLSLDLFHEPTLSVQWDAKGNMTAQQLVGLADLHFFPLWKAETEVTLNAFVNEQVNRSAAETKKDGDGGKVSGGAQVQVEQHLTGMLSLTFSVSGTVGGGSFLSAGGGLLIHFDTK